MKTVSVVYIGIRIPEENLKNMPVDDSEIDS